MDHETLRGLMCGYLTSMRKALEKGDEMFVASYWMKGYNTWIGA